MRRKAMKKANECLFGICDAHTEHAFVASTFQPSAVWCASSSLRLFC